MSMSLSEDAPARLIEPSSPDCDRTSGHFRKAPGVDSETDEVTAAKPTAGLDVVIEHELPRMGPQADLVDLVEPLVLDPRLDEVVGEHAACPQEVVVDFQ